MWGRAVGGSRETRPTPPMPVAWTKELHLFPIRLGLATRIELVTYPTTVLAFSEPKGSHKFPPTPKGWVELWDAVAASCKEDRYQGAAMSVAQSMRYAKSTPFRNAPAFVAAESLGPLLVSAVTFLGGAGHGEWLKEGRVVDMRLGTDSLLFLDIRDGKQLAGIRLSDLTSVEATGPGKQVSGGFVATGGHGLIGDVADQASASWATDKFGSTIYVTSVRVEAPGHELFFRTLTESPEQVQVALAPLRTTIRQRGQLAPMGDPRVGSAAAPEEDLVSQLERLARLHANGALTSDEYQAAKDKLLR